MAKWIFVKRRRKSWTLFWDRENMMPEFVHLELMARVSYFITKPKNFYNNWRKGRKKEYNKKQGKFPPVFPVFSFICFYNSSLFLLFLQCFLFNFTFQYINTYTSTWTSTRYIMNILERLSLQFSNYNFYSILNFTKFMEHFITNCLKTCNVKDESIEIWRRCRCRRRKKRKKWGHHLIWCFWLSSIENLYEFIRIHNF